MKEKERDGLQFGCIFCNLYRLKSHMSKAWAQSWYLSFTLKMERLKSRFSFVCAWISVLFLCLLNASFSQWMGEARAKETPVYITEF